MRWHLLPDHTQNTAHPCSDGNATTRSEKTHNDSLGSAGSCISRYAPTKSSWQNSVAWLCNSPLPEDTYWRDATAITAVVVDATHADVVLASADCHYYQWRHSLQPVAAVVGDVAAAVDDVAAWLVAACASYTVAVVEGSLIQNWVAFAYIAAAAVVAFAFVVAFAVASAAVVVRASYSAAGQIAVVAEIAEGWVSPTPAAWLTAH